MKARIVVFIGKYKQVLIGMVLAAGLAGGWVLFQHRYDHANLHVVIGWAQSTDKLLVGDAKAAGLIKRIETLEKAAGITPVAASPPVK